MSEYGVNHLNMRLLSTWTHALDEFSTWMRAAARSENTIRLRRYWVTRLATATPTATPVTIDELDVTVWLASGDWSPSTRKSAMSSVRRFFAWMQLHNHRSDDPTARLLTIQTPAYRARPIPDTVLRQALAAAPDTASTLMLMLPAYAGLRRAEIAESHTSHISKGWLRVVGKGRRTRMIPIHPELAPLLALKSVGYYFPSPRAPHLSPDNIGRKITALLGGSYSPHHLRHWFATKTYAATHDIRAVQELLGHTNVSTTQAYIGVNDLTLSQAIMALPSCDLPLLDSTENTR